MPDGGESTVLFVDDEPLERELYADFFEQVADVEPVVARSAAEAFDLLESTGVDCLVSDGIMTRDGESFVTVVKETYPDLDTILYSGAQRAELPVDQVERYLWKGSQDRPAASLETLAATIREMTATGSRELEADGAGGEWQVLGNFSWEPGVDVGSTVIQALADQTDRSVVDFPPLYDVIDSDALSRLVVTATDRAATPSIQVQFVYDDRFLRITSDGMVTYRPAITGR